MTKAVAPRAWLTPAVADRVRHISSGGLTGTAVLAEIERLAAENQRIHDDECVNLNPATNVMNPPRRGAAVGRARVRAVARLPGREVRDGPRGDRADRGLAAELAARVFDARYAEVRVGSGALANLYAFMATCRPGRHDRRAAGRARRPRHPPRGGAAGLYGLTTVPAPVDADGYTVDVDALR